MRTAMPRAACLLALLAAPVAAQGPPPWPRLPGAVESAPSWLAGTPFDLAKFFAMPPAAENAAPLYLEALAEFSGDVAECFPPERRAAIVAAGARWKGWSPTSEAWMKEPSSVPVAKVDAMVADYKEGFRKLDLAQRRGRCVFATGLTLDSLLPHAQAARQVARLLAVRGLRAADRGDFEGAIGDVGRSLRLSRDLRPRAPAICQLVSIAVDGFCCEQLVRPLLTRRGLKPEHCDRLVKLLAEHESKAVDPFTIGSEAEYLLLRSIFRCVDEGFETTTGPDGLPREARLDAAGKRRALLDLIRIVGGEADPAKIAAADLLDPKKLAADRRACDDAFKALLAAPPTYAGRSAVAGKIQKALRADPNPSLYLLFAPDFNLSVLSAARDLANLGATRSLIALRRWELAHPRPAVDLAAACKAAGMPGVPADPFSGSALKLATVGGEAVVYSVGADGVDDRALKDAEQGAKPEGDFLYRIPRRK